MVGASSPNNDCCVMVKNPLVPMRTELSATMDSCNLVHVFPFIGSPHSYLSYLIF